MVMRVKVEVMMDIRLELDIGALLIGPMVLVEIDSHLRAYTEIQDVMEGGTVEETVIESLERITEWIIILVGLFL